MDYLEAARRIENHKRVHHMEEQPRCEKITEALTLAVKVLEQYSNTGVVMARFMGVPIECQQVSPDATILLRYEIFEHDIETVKRVYEGIQHEFPDNRIVVLPKTMDFERISRASLVGIKEQIDNILEGLPEWVI